MNVVVLLENYCLHAKFLLASEDSFPLTVCRERM